MSRSVSKGRLREAKHRKSRSLADARVVMITQTRNFKTYSPGCDNTQTMKFSAAFREALSVAPIRAAYAA